MNFWEAERFNTKFKCYPDGNFISTTSNRLFFMTLEDRKRVRLARLEAMKEMKERGKLIAEGSIKWALHLAEVTGVPFVPSDTTFQDIVETNEILESLIAKAKKMGIPVNGVTYFTEDGKPPKLGNIRRARDRIFDLIYLNQFDYFATFTFNPRKTDSFDVREVMKKVKKWLDNHQRRNGLKYVMVPEYHKSGRIHLHMLYSGDLKLKNSGKRTKQGKIIYNCKSWKYGFSTVIPTDNNRAKLAFYVSKYVTKDVQKIFGKYYYSSQGLVREAPVQYGNRVFSDIQAPVVHVDAIDISFKYESSIRVNSASENSAEILKELGLEMME